MQAQGLAGVGADTVEGYGAGLGRNDLRSGVIRIHLPVARNDLFKDEGLNFGAAVVEQEILFVDGDGAALDHAVFCFLIVMGRGLGVFGVADGWVPEWGGLFVGVILGGVGEDAAVFVDVDFLGIVMGGDGVGFVVFGAGWGGLRRCEENQEGREEGDLWHVRDSSTDA